MMPTIEELTADLMLHFGPGGKVAVELSGFQAFCLIAQLQLASRHPHNTGWPAHVAEEIMALLHEQMPESAQAVLDLGYDPANDVPAGLF